MSKISILKDENRENRFIYNNLEAMLFEKWEELIYYGKSWNIRQVCFEYLMFTNFVALTFCLAKKHELFSFFNEALRSSKFHKLPFNLRKYLNWNYLTICSICNLLCFIISLSANELYLNEHFKTFYEAFQVKFYIKSKLTKCKIIYL
jgi:hypothetical protein